MHLPQRDVPVEDFDRLKLHEDVRALSWLLFDISKETDEISKREQAGDVLSRGRLRPQDAQPQTDD